MLQYKWSGSLAIVGQDEWIVPLMNTRGTACYYYMPSGNILSVLHGAENIAPLVHDENVSSLCEKVNHTWSSS